MSGLPLPTGPGAAARTMIRTYLGPSAGSSRFDVKLSRNATHLAFGQRQRQTHELPSPQLPTEPLTLLFRVVRHARDVARVISPGHGCCRAGQRAATAERPALRARICHPVHPAMAARSRQKRQAIILANQEYYCYLISTNERIDGPPFCTWRFSEPHMPGAQTAVASIGQWSCRRTFAVP